MQKSSKFALGSVPGGRRFLARAIVPALLIGCSAGTAVAGPTLTFGKEGSVTLSYLTQMWTQYRSYSGPTPTSSVPNDSGTTQFFLRRNRFNISGQFNNYLGFYTQIDAPNDGKFGVANKGVFYRDAYLTFDYSDAIRLIGGKFKQTFTRENLEDCFGPLTMDRSEVISYTPFGGSRDDGIALWGNLHNAMFQYRIMVANGRNNSAVMPKHLPRITARFDVSLLEPEYAYGYEGTYLGTKKVLTIGLAYDYQKDVAYADYPARKDPVSYKAWTADLFYEHPFSTGTYTFSTAYIHYDTGNAINRHPDPSLPVNTQLSGYYVKAAYMLPSKVGIGRLQFFVRHEQWNYHLTGSRSGLYNARWNSGGVNYYIDGQNLKISAAFARVTYPHQAPTSPALQDYNQATLGVQMIF
ncbi:MAG TPA: porin [Gammaproteobacteria bacterium]|nr:phosphate-selective porin O and P [bacterium BMS3Abin12]GBE49483.1 phosphate-selective porin O and P [bacterium BMS3Bbin13]HDJ86252.1 porin [Chromatiales bacterium]HDK02813.1 porin [Gammaproteobacteria bacterium]